MAGLPAGFEDDSDDDQFVMYNGDHVDEQFYTPDVKPKPDLNYTKTFASNPTPQKINFFKQGSSLIKEEFYTAVTHNNIESVKKFLADGFDVNTRIHSGWSALMTACCNGHHQIAQLLIEHKADVNFEQDKFTTLMAACYASNKNEEDLLICAKYLIEKGAKVNTRDRNLMSPLMYASRQGYSKMVKLLCEKSANVDQQEARGWTALCFASWKGYVHVVKVLLSHGADAHMATLDGQKACDLAFSQGYKMLSELLETYDSSQLDQLNEMPDKLTSLKSTGGSKYIKYGDLELFLHGLELGYLVPKFQEHQLQFPDLLKLTEKEMIEIGIKELGIRKKLLGAIRDVHTNEWDMSSVKNVEQLKKLTILEMAAIISNVNNHLLCIESSIKFVRQNIEKKKDELIKDDPSNHKVLIQQSQEASRVSLTLQEQMSSLDSYLLQIFPNHNRKAVNLIEKEKGRKDTRYMKTFAMLSVIGISGIAVYFGFKYLKEDVS